MYTLDFSTRTERFLKKLDKHIASRIIKKLENLKENPVPSDVVFIGREGGDKVFRYRIGDYRALYKLKDSEKIVLITKIDKRPRVYD
jgi:mRNA interferase RelE/StbE